MVRKEAVEVARFTPFRLAGPLSLLDEMTRDYGDFFRGLGPAFGWWPATAAAPAIFPKADIYESDGTVVLKAELPGLKKEELNLKIVDNVLTISGQKRQEEKVEEKDYYRMERSYGSFTRSYTLPAAVRTDQVKARFKDGVLEVTFPKSEEALRKENRIAIE